MPWRLWWFKIGHAAADFWPPRPLVDKLCKEIPAVTAAINLRCWDYSLRSRETGPDATFEGDSGQFELTKDDKAPATSRTSLTLFVDWSTEDTNIFEYLT